jgi:hypothetical protein
MPTFFLVTKLGGLPFLIEQIKEFQVHTDITNASMMLNNLSNFEQLRKNGTLVEMCH